jgi:DNA-binding XRE family transcriptional regulator
MLSPKQSPAARGWLDWSQDNLAKRANTSLATIREFEKGRRVPIKDNLAAIRLSFEWSASYSCSEMTCGSALSVITRNRPGLERDFIVQISAFRCVPNWAAGLRPDGLARPCDVRFFNRF